MRFTERKAIAATLNRQKDKIRFIPAYSGGLLYTDDNPYPSVIDIDSCQLESEIPILFRHDENACVGYVTEAWKEGNRIYANGKIGSTEEALFLVNNEALLKVQTLDETIRLKPSIGADYRFQNTDTQKVFIPYGDKTTVNGREFFGPCYVLYDTYLTEISLVIHAGDPESRAVLAELRGSHTMSWEDFLTGKGLDPDSYAALSVEEQNAIKQEFDATALDSTGVTAEGDIPVEAPPKEVIDAGEALAEAVLEVAPTPDAAEELAAVITEVALDEMGTDAVTAEGETEEEKKAVLAEGEAEEKKKAVTAEGCEDEKKAVAARLRKRVAAVLSKHSNAIQAGIRKRKIQERVNHYRATVAKYRPAMRAGIRTPRNQEDRILAGFAASCGLSDESIQKYVFKDMPKQRAEQAINASISTGRHGAGRVSFRELLDYQFKSRGLPGLTLSDNKMAITQRWQAASHPTAIRAGISTFDAQDALRLVVNAFALDAIEHMESVHQLISKEERVNDFGKTKFARINIKGRLQPMGRNGKFEHLTAEHEELEVTTDATAAVLKLSMMDLIDDTLNLLGDIGQQLAWNAEYGLEVDFFKLLRSMIAGTTNAADGNAFFSDTYHHNVLAGASYALSAGESAMNAANAKFKKFKDANDAYIRVLPSILLTGTNNFFSALRIYESEGLNVVDTVGNKNIWFNKYQAIESPYLDADEGGSDTQWLLFGDPTKHPAITVTKLAGYEQPVIEQNQQPDFDEWTIGYRVIYPYGLNPMFTHGALLVTGVAAS